MRQNRTDQPPVQLEYGREKEVSALRDFLGILKNTLLISLGIVLVLGLAVGIWAYSAFAEMDEVRVTVINESDRPITGIVVAGSGSFRMPIGDLKPGAKGMRSDHFRNDQGPSVLQFSDGTQTGEAKIGYLLTDDGPYDIEVRVRAKDVQVHVEKPTDEPATWVETR